MMRINVFRPRTASALAAFAIVLTVCAPVALATDLTDIGYVDQLALANTPAFQSASQQLAGYKASLDRQFAAAIHGVRDSATQARVAQEFQNKFVARQRELFGPLFGRAQVAVASVASSRNLSVVVDKRIIIVGGQDITRAVADLLTGVGDPVPPVNTPPPSNVGFIDQAQLDQVAKLKTANAEFTKFQADESAQVQAKLKSAKTDADKQQIFKDAAKAIADHRKTTVDPIVDQTRGVIAGVARKRGLLLVIDRANLVYGGADITSDVAGALK